jgi:hypothetical protein
MRFHLSVLTFILSIGCFPLIVNAEPWLKANISDVSCFGKKDGKIQLAFLNSQPSDYNILISDSVSQKLKEFTPLQKEPFVIENLSAGKYGIQISTPDTIEQQIVSVESPERLELEVIKIVGVEGKGESVLSSLKAFPVGGVQPYAYKWSENTGNQMGEIAKKLPLGIYNCKVDDSNKCGSVEATFYLFEDEIEKFNLEKRN